AQTQMSFEDFRICSLAKLRMKFTDALRHCAIPPCVRFKQILCLMLEVIQIGIGRENSGWHDELPFTRPESASEGQKVSSYSQLCKSGGLLSFPRTGCALNAETV